MRPLFSSSRWLCPVLARVVEKRCLVCDVDIEQRNNEMGGATSHVCADLLFCIPLHCRLIGLRTRAISPRQLPPAVTTSLRWRGRFMFA
jgi:hypothetical protein